MTQEKPSIDSAVMVGIVLLLIFFVGGVLACKAFGQLTPTPGDLGGNPIVRYESHGFGYQWDLHGNSTQTFLMPNGSTAYTARDREGRIVSQGYLFSAIPPATVLPLPSSELRETLPLRALPHPFPLKRN